MKEDTGKKIIKYINKNGQASANELIGFLGISRQALFKHHLSKMVENKVLVKIGKPPKVFYLLNEEKPKNEIKIESSIKKNIDKNYLIITPTGTQKMGWEGFVYWCEKNNQEIIKTAGEYIKTLKKYDQYKKSGLINGIAKFRNSFEKVYLNKLYYLDFYSIERFGKTRLGQMLLYGKQSGNKKLIKDIVAEIKPKIEYIIKKYNINAIGFIPWTVKREIQFMRELERNLKLNIKSIRIEKIKTEIIVPQKTLNKIKDRIENAKNTIVVTDDGQYNNLLLIDDAVGSGATLNETAKQIKNKKIAKKIIGLSITGSFKGFDVISEV
jgi:hypothetical protein